MFSHQNVSVLGKEICNSPSRDSSHAILEVTQSNTQYSTSVIDLKTMLCFLEDYKTLLAPK